MAEIKFEHLLGLIQSKESIPNDMLSSQDGLWFGDIHFVPLWCSLHMQWVSLHYLSQLLKPEGISKILYSHSMAILLIFLSDDVLNSIKHIHIGLMVCCVGSELFGQDGILPFIDSIETDLKEVREMHEQGKQVGQVWFYTYLVAKYGGVMAIPTDLPYCLMYPMVCDGNVKDKTHFNTVGPPSGLHIKACMCHCLLHLVDMDPANRQKFKGSCLLVPRGMQYKTLLPILAEPCNHHGLLMDLNTGEPYPMEVAGNFCLEDAFFPSSPGDSLMFCDNELI